MKAILHFVIISRSDLRKMRNISDSSCREYQNTRFSSFFFKNRAVYEIIRKNMLEPDRPQMTMWRMRIACWITKAKNTHSQYVNLCFSIATIVSRPLFIVTLYVHCFSCLHIVQNNFTLKC